MSLDRISCVKKDIIVFKLAFNMDHAKGVFNNSNNNTESFKSCCANGVRKTCKKIFDGLLEWPETNSGELITLPCPLTNNNFGPEYHAKGRYASKYCTETGDWYWHPESNQTWTNYTNCWTYFDNESGLVELVNTQKLLQNAEYYRTWLPIMKSISLVGYILSLCFLILSLIIFATIKKLHCPRNKLHVHLFVSFLMRGITYILKDFIFVDGTAMASGFVKVDKSIYIKEHSNWHCKFLMAARNYFILANYMFILMEGIYLINLMFITIFSKNRHVIVYCILGWGLPLVLISIWVFLKISFKDILCWTFVDTYYTTLIKVPITITLVINFIIFIVMLRVLCGKINSMNIREKRVKYRKLTRSTLTLVLLLGTPYVLSEIISYNTNQLIEIIWLFFDQTFTSVQGLIVAFTYCLLNSEVQTEIKQRYKSFYRKKRQSRSRTISNTQQFSIPLQEEGENAAVYWHRDKSSIKEITCSP